jgi:hypothetical protein
MKIHSVGAVLFQADRQMDDMTNGIVDIRIFTKALKNSVSVLEV